MRGTCGHTTSETPSAIDATQGDRAFVTQLVRQGDPNPDLGESYVSVRKAFLSDSLQVIDGKEAMIAGSFFDVPQKNIQISMDAASFEASAVDVHPNAAIMETTRLLVHADQGGAERAVYGPRLLDYTARSINAFLTSFDFGNPYPSTWFENYEMSVDYSMQLVVPGAMTPKVVTASIGRFGPVSSLQTTKLEPLISPPREVQINGQPAAAGHSSAGTTPTISWSAPSKGTAAAYAVYVFRLHPTMLTRTVGSLRTSETSVTLPPGILEVGSYHYLRIRAITRYNPKAPLMLDNEPSGYAEALTGLITP